MIKYSVILGWLLSVHLSRGDEWCYLGGWAIHEGGVARVTQQRSGVLVVLGAGNPYLVAERPFVSQSWRSAPVVERVSSSLTLPVGLTHGELAFLEGCEGKHSLS